jgi:hypothetical protein
MEFVNYKYITEISLKTYEHATYPTQQGQHILWLSNLAKKLPTISIVRTKQAKSDPNFLLASVYFSLAFALPHSSSSPHQFTHAEPSSPFPPLKHWSSRRQGHECSTMCTPFGSRALPTTPMSLVPPEAPSHCWRQPPHEGEDPAPPFSSLIITTFDSGTRGASGGAEWSARWRRRPVTQVLQPFPSLVDLGSMVCFATPPSCLPTLSAMNALSSRRSTLRKQLTYCDCGLRWRQ